jgi:simple sugar transport system permease protein
MAQATAESTPKEKQPAPARMPGRDFWRTAFNALLIPVLAIFTAMVLSGFIIAFSDPKVLALLPQIGSQPLQLLGAIWNSIWISYFALFQGAFGDPVAMFNGFQTWLGTGNAVPLLRALRDPAESLVAATPYIFAGLAVAVGFKGGLFNIGVEGQLYAGGIACVLVGYAVTGLPWFLYLPLALAAGFVAGGLWGAIPGYLKAARGVNEVINTIMLNYVIFRFADWVVGPNGPMNARGGSPRSPGILDSAKLPQFLPDPVRLHWGFVLAIIAVFFVYWLLWKTTIGFEIRTVGASPTAAKYAGMAVGKVFIISMGLSGALAGLGGANELLGLNHYFASAFSPGYGFDAIALALLGKSNPFGVLASALLFGALRNGATRMQSIAGVPVDIISVMQALIIAFIAAPEIVRYLYRLRVPAQKEGEIFARGWGG